MRYTRLCLVVVLIGLLTACKPVNAITNPAPDPAVSANQPATANSVALESTAPDAVVVAVIDGDTVDVNIAGRRERVRLIGIDTPETKKPNTAIECWGPEATTRTSELLAPGTPVHLLRDAELRDDYGRLLAYVFRLPDDLFVNLTLAAEGFATPLKIAPNTLFAKDFAAASAAARSAGLGLWRVCPTPTGS